MSLNLNPTGVKLSRRQFAFSLAGLAALSLSRVHKFPSFGPTVSEEQAREIYRRAVVVDCNTWPPFDGTLPIPQSGLDTATRSGITIVKATVGGASFNFEQTVDEIAAIQGIVETHPDHFLLVRQHSDIERAKRESKMGVILSFESTEMFGSDLSRLPLFRRLGVRVMQITYNRRSLFGDGCLEPANAGLSNLGRQAVKQMNEMGVACDLSHSGVQTTMEAIALSTKPTIFSHAGCKSVHDHPRNKDDAEMRALAERGGVMGIYFLPFIGGEAGQPPTLEIYMKHMEHALSVCGEDHVGVGSDIDITPVNDTPEWRRQMAASVAERKRLGISAPEEDRPPYIPELNNPRRLEGIAIALAKRGYSAAVIEKVIGGNFQRVFRDIWGST
ncbi:MAG TPA: membrane dipeptidase [Pyrinomonadaceae bacterium]|nr:membrane dipeptidase [Pyrinomonadaceae bacterium]